MTKLMRKVVFVLFLFMLAWPFAKETIWQKLNVSFAFLDFKTNDYYRALRFDSPSYRAIAWIRSHTNVDDKVFVIRQSDFANYGGRSFIYALDPKSEPLYKAESVEELKSVIEKMGLKYFFLPNYDLPFYYNTHLMDLLSDPKQAQLLFYDEGVRVLKLVESSKPERVIVKSTEFSVNDKKWLCSTGRSHRCNAEVGSDSATGITFETFAKNINRSTELIYGSGQPFVSPANMGLSLDLRNDRDYEFIVEIEGSAKLQVDMVAFSKSQYVGKMRLWNGVIHPGKTEKIKAQFRFSSQIDSGKPIFRMLGTGQVQIKSIILNEYESLNKDSLKRSADISKRWSFLVTGSRKKMTYWDVESSKGKSFLNSITFPSSVSQLVVSPLFSLDTEKIRVSLEAKGCGQLISFLLDENRKLRVIGNYNLPESSELSSESSFDLSKEDVEELNQFRKLKKNVKDMVIPLDIQSYVDDMDVPKGKAHLILAHRSGNGIRGQSCDPSILSIDSIAMSEDCSQKNCPVIFKEDF